MIPVACVAGVVFVVGCSRVKIAYEYADWIADREIQKLVSLNSRQEKDLEGALNGYFRWHRREMLPRYADFASELARNLERPVLPADEVASLQDRFWKLLRDTLKPAAGPTAALTAGLKDSQIEELARNLEKGNREKRREFDLKAEALARKRLAKVKDWAADWMGGLSREQEKLILEEFAAHPFPYGLWIENRRHQQRQFLEHLRSRSREAVIRAYLETLLANPDQTALPEYASALKVVRNRTASLVHAVLARSTEGQRSRLKKRLDRLVRDFRELSRED